VTVEDFVPIDPARVSAGPDPASGPADPEREHVLVVDDEESVRRLFVRVLERAGFVATEAPDGRAALESIDHAVPDVVLLDCTMPRLTGLEVVQALRGDPRTVTLPVILVTGQGELDDRVAGLAAGADDFVTKPVHPEELVARVRAQLRGQHAWHDTMERQWRARSELAEALTRIPPAATAEGTADVVCAVLVGLSAVERAAVVGWIGDDAVVLATRSVPGWTPGRVLDPAAGAGLRDRARSGPWTDETTLPSTATGAEAAPVAYAPLWSHDRLIGVLAMAVDRASADRPALPVGSVLAMAVDLAPIIASILDPQVVQRATDAQRGTLERVVGEREFASFFQPVFDLDDRSTVGYEALTRFEDGASPSVRFAEAGRLGLRGELEAVTLLAAAEAAAALPAGAWLSLNASARLLSRREVHEAIAEVGRPVVVELTEHERIDDYEAVNRALKLLKPGTRLAVDDAGAGYASLRHILTLRPDFIKLDRDWVEAIEGDPARQALVAGLLHFARSLGARLVAEGIETEAELTTLRGIGVELGQGYLFARPAPATTFVQGNGSGPIRPNP
jgi:EAL domain-containing protein (putative c-di-GMP-specific phosphodiesterase class I)/FixJ family two-component response regulator